MRAAISVGVCLWSLQLSAAIWVVEREKGAVALLEDGRVSSEVAELGNLNHATIKFKSGFAYVISRDGFLSKIDIQTKQRVKKIKAGNSGIGLDFVDDHIAVANYSPTDVAIFDLDLNEVKRIPTGSKNVGIKSLGSRLIFSLMDSDALWVLDRDQGYKRVYEVPHAGQMPFDAFLSGSKYVVGFFKEKSIGILDLGTMKYTKLDPKTDKNELILKVPHFGTWGVVGSTAYVPMVGARSLQRLNLTDFKSMREVSLVGTPVFAVVSPDQKKVVVNYSGDQENKISIIDVQADRVIHNLEVGKRVMHMRFSSDGGRLYVSTYFDNKVREFGTADWKVLRDTSLEAPSGIFLDTSQTEQRREIQK